MAQNIVEQFTNMLNSRFSLRSHPHPSLKMKRSIRETVTYPKINITDENDSCLNPPSSCEHVLSCGHIVNTVLPSEPCAPNCHHVSNTEIGMDRSLKVKNALKMKNSRTVSTNSFYCDACVETEIEARISPDISSSNAEQRRATLRAEEAKARGKATKYRKCYIALKFTSVPCHSDGSLLSRYVPREERHPFDNSLPQTGENMFEDVDPNPTEPVMEEEVMGEAKENLNGVVSVADETDTKEGGQIGGRNVQNATNRLGRTRSQFTQAPDRAQRLAAAVAKPSDTSGHRTSACPSLDILTDVRNYETDPTAASQRNPRNARTSNKRKRGYIGSGHDEEDQNEIEEEQEPAPARKWKRVATVTSKATIKQGKK